MPLPIALIDTHSHIYAEEFDADRDEAIRRALLKDANDGQVEPVSSVRSALDEIDRIPDEPKERKGVLDEEFI